MHIYNINITYVCDSDQHFVIIMIIFTNYILYLKMYYSTEYSIQIRSTYITIGKSLFHISKGGWFSVDSFIVVQCFKPRFKCAGLI